MKTSIKTKAMETKKQTSKKAKTSTVKKSLAAKPKAAKKADMKTSVKPKVIVVKKVAKPSFKKVQKKSKTISAPKKIFEAKKTAGKNESMSKRVAYMLLSVIFGLLIGTFLSLFVELVYMKKMMAVGGDLSVNYFMGIPSYLPGFAELFFLIAGLAFGVWLGFWGWRFVYIERRHRTTRSA